MKKLVLIALAASLLFCSACTYHIEKLLDGQAIKNLTEKLGEVDLDSLNGERAQSADYELIPESQFDPYDAREIQPDLCEYPDLCESMLELSYDEYETVENEYAFGDGSLVYSGPLNMVIDGMKDAECYVYYDSPQNAYLVDYRHYTYGELTAAELADIYQQAIASVTAVYGDDYYTSFTLSSLHEIVALIEAATADGDDYLYAEWLLDAYGEYVRVYLVPGIDRTSIDFSFGFPYDYSWEASAETTPTPEPEEKSTPAPQSNTVIISDYLHFIPSDDPYDEDTLVITASDAQPDGNGGFDCSVTFLNQSTAVSVRIYYSMYALGSDNMEENMLAEDVFARAGSNTYEFHVPAYMLENGDCEVFFDYEWVY
ncbi:hypothetical protein LJC56_00875 [Christensenellaceae bacterium OttesenSCG-928-K19]|nr:hypothetical protein [Christensenellaceae bacterium OttesenSCG-928-K19]